MGNIPPDTQTLLEQLRRHLQDAKVRYDFAKTYAEEVRQDFAKSLIDETVEMLGYRKALRSEIEALTGPRRRNPSHSLSGIPR